MDAVDTEDFASLDDINPTLHEMADPPVLAHTFPDAAKSIPDSLDEITQSLKLLDKKNDEARDCETEADLDKSLSTITMALLQDTSSRSSSSDEDDINDISFNEVIGADGTSAPVTMGSESPVKSLAVPEDIESEQPPSIPAQNFTDAPLDSFLDVTQAPPVMVEEDNCDEPKDIEIDYDDTAEAESAESSLQCLIKKCDVLLPNFTYENKHTNKAGRFSISKLSQSHPEFFNKKKKKNGNNFVSKSMGGGFSAKIKAPAAAKSPTAAKSSTAAKSPAKKSQETKGGKKKGKTNDVKKEEKESEPIETPKLTEVTIRDLQVSVERLHKNIVSFKHKQYLDFLEYQKKKSEGDTVAPGTPKQQKGKGQTKPKETPKSSPKVEETKQTNSKGKSKLMEKYKDLLSSDSSGTDDEAPTNTKPPPAKAKVKKNEPKEVKKAAATATLERNGKKESRSRSTSSTKEIKSDVKIAAQSRSRSNSTDVKSIKSPASKRRDSRKSSSESVGDKKVFQNPLWQNQEEKKDEQHSEDVREKDKEKLVEMLFSLIKGSKASVATNDIKTETPAEPTVKSTPAEKPKSVPTKAALKETPCLPSQDSQDLSSKDDATPSVSDCDNSKENDNVDKVNDKNKKKDISGDIFDQLLSGKKSTTEKESTAENQEDSNQITSMQVDSDQDDIGGLDNTDSHSIHDQDEEPEISVAPQSPPKATSINKSDLITRQKSLPSDIFNVNDDMKLLHDLIQQFVWQKRIKPDTLGDLEDLVATAMENVNNMQPDRTRDKDDGKFLTEHKIQRSVRVNVSHAHKINKYHELYESAMKTYNMEELREKNILYWRTEKIFEHANKCLKEVKEKHTRARSSSSSDESPVRERLSSPNPVARKRKGQIESDSEDETSSTRDKSKADRDSSSHSQKDKHSDKNDRHKDKRSKDSHDRSRERSRDRQDKQGDKSSRTPQIQRARDENRKPRDPNKFVIPKKDKSQESSTKPTPTNMRSILEEGLKKASPGGSNQKHNQNRYNNQSRYQDWKKEKRIKEAKKIVDLKKIEVNCANAPNLDSILSSMDQITKKPEKKPETDKKEDKKDGGKSGPSQEELRRARQEEEEQRAKEKAEREQERLRHQELRHAEVVNNRLTENRDVDLVSDEWGQPKPTIPGKMASLSIAKPNLKPPILAPSVDDYDEPAQDDYLDNNDDDDDDDDFDLPAPVAALPSAEDELKVSQKPAQAQPEPLQEEIEDNFDDYGGGGDDAPDNYSDDDLDNMDQTQSKTQYETLNSKERLVKDKNEIRSRTPSPFLSTNRYYPEFYAKKAEEERAEKEKAKQTKLSKSSPKNDSNDAAENEKEDTSSKHTSVKQQQSEESNKRDSRIDNIKFSTDIDERIARYFRERRSKKEKKHKKSIIKDFEIDPNSSFLDAAANKSENAISRLTGDGLGLFINKVITSLSKSKSSPDPSSVPKPCPPPAQSSESPSKIPLPVAVPQPVPPPQPFTGLTPQPVPHPSAPRLGILPAPPPPPLPPPPPPPIEEGEKLPVELEPGELPDSPHHSLLSQSAEDDDDTASNSTINFKDADIDDSMILEIVAELDDTLEEEEQLAKAKEKLAKRLLKKKAQSFQKMIKSKPSLQPPVDVEPPKPDIDRRQSVRKQMMNQLPYPDDLDPFQDNVVQPPPPPPGHRPNAIPPLMPPSVNSSHGTESSRGTECNENSKFGASGRTPFSDENLGEEAINDFASDWGVDTGDSYNNESNDYDRDGHKEEYSSALTKLRGQRIMPGGPIDGHKPSSMLSALEKLRNFNKRGFNDTASPFGNKRFKFGNQDGPWFGSRDNSGYDEMSKNEQDDINSTLNLPFRKNNEETFFNQAIQNNRWNSNNLNQGVQNNFDRFDRTTPDNRSMDSRSFDRTNPEGQFMGPGGFDRTTPEGRSMGPGGFDRTTPEDRFMGPGGLDRTTPEGRFMGPGGFNRTNPEGRFMGPGGVDRTNNEGRFLGPEGHGRTTSEGRFMGPGGFDRTIPEGRFKGPGGFDRTTPEGRFMGPGTNFSENDNNMMNQLEPGEERDEPVNYKDVPDKDLLPILLKRNITTECERLYLENLVQQWIGIVSTDYDNLADQFKRNLADRRADRNRRLDSLVDLGTLYADFRLNMKVYDLTSGEEKSVFSSFKTDGIMMFKCEICSITVNSKKNLETHFMGKKHGNKLSEYSIVEGSTDPVEEKKTSLLDMHDTSVLSQLLEKYRAAALVGLEFAVEVWWQGERDPRHHCLLCNFQCGIMEFMFHLLSAQHRLNYMERFFPIAHAKFNRVMNRGFWEQSTYDGLDFVISRIEFKFKRMKPLVSDNGEDFMENNSAFYKAAESVQHARECPSLNFANIADPFKNYIHRLPRAVIRS